MMPYKAAVLIVGLRFIRPGRLQMYARWGLIHDDWGKLYTLVQQLPILRV